MRYFLSLAASRDYNMVDVAVAMVISTMHEKASINLHNSRKIDKKFRNSVIPISRIHHDEIAKVELVWISKVILTIRRNYSESYTLQSWTEFVFQLSLMPEKVIEAWFTKLTIQDICHLRISTFIFCVDLVTPE